MDTKHIETAIAQIVTRTLLAGIRRTANVAPQSSSATFGVEPRPERRKFYLITEEELVAGMVAKLDFFDMARAVVEALLTEEHTDDLVEAFLARVNFPWYVPERLVRSQLDKRLPEDVKAPLLAFLLELEKKTGVGG